MQSRETGAAYGGAVGGGDAGADSPVSGVSPRAAAFSAVSTTVLAPVSKTKLCVRPLTRPRRLEVAVRPPGDRDRAAGAGDGAAGAQLADDPVADARGLRRGRRSRRPGEPEQRPDQQRPQVLAQRGCGICRQNPATTRARMPPPPGEPGELVGLDADRRCVAAVAEDEHGQTSAERPSAR